MVITLAVSALGGVVATTFTNDVKRALSSGKVGARSALTNVLNGIITSPAVLHASLYNPTCVNTQLTLPLPNLNLGGSTCIDTSGALGPDGFRPIALRSPFDGTVLLTGTTAAPVRYSVGGEICLAASSLCAFEVSTSFSTTATFTENGVAKPAVRVRYEVRSQNSVSNGDRQAISMFQGEATIPLEKINRRSDPVAFEACPNATGAIDPAALGEVKLGVEREVGWVNTEKAICIAALGARLCPMNRFQVGKTANGDPICAGAKQVCPTGQVQIGYRAAAGGGVEPQCVVADCSNRGGQFGFLHPSAGDNLAVGVGCILVEPRAGCEDRIKTTIDDLGDLGC